MARARARGGRRAVLLAALLLLLHASFAAALRTSAISAAPEYPPHPRLPTAGGHGGGRHAAPAFPPVAALSPDIMPLLPSPGPDSDGTAAPPPSDAMPTIPSSPSPPNPDALEPDSALAPFGSAPAVAAQSTAPPPSTTAARALAVAVGLVAAMWLV